MRIRSFLAVAALAASTAIALPAVAGNPTAECGAGAPFAKYGDQLTFEEGTDAVDLTITRTKSAGEVMSFTWTSDTPVLSFVVKAGKGSTTVLADGATSGTFTVPAKYAISHATFCLGEEAPDVVTPAGRARFICWGEEAGGYYAVFSYNNQSVNQDGVAVAVDRTTAGFATSYASLASQFPTIFQPTAADTFDDAIEFTVTGWDGVSPLTFELFGTTKQASLNNESQMCV